MNMTIDPFILGFSALTVIATIWMGFRSARTSKTASDFFVAGRSVSVGWNASAISGEYLSAASFMGVAGMVMSSGYDALWYPVCYACGYLFLLLFIAGPLRRFGAYTIPDFAEGRFDSPLFRKIAVVFVLFIGFFYTMPQMKGAGTTLAYIFPGLPYWAGVVLVGAVITLNVALGGMKGITLVQAFQYWAKMFAISVPIFVLMSVYGGYGTHLKNNASTMSEKVSAASKVLTYDMVYSPPSLADRIEFRARRLFGLTVKDPSRFHGGTLESIRYGGDTVPIDQLLSDYGQHTGTRVFKTKSVEFRESIPMPTANLSFEQFKIAVTNGLASHGFALIHADLKTVKVVPTHLAHLVTAETVRKALPEKAPADNIWINPFGPLTTKAAKAAKLSPEQTRPYSLLYTYSLIIALVCGTAGLPHILVRFYTNPDGAAAKRTTMWVMILIGVFYVFPPMFGVLGRNLLPELYTASGAKGSDKIVLELPRMLNERVPMLGSIMSGITCAGAFAAFMSTFSGLLVSMTGALAHDVYGRILRPKSTAEERMRMFKICSIICGAGAVALGLLVEKFEINKMVGWAFAIAAASYFPLLFMSAWWRGMTMKGAASGMLIGGLLSLITVVSTMVADQAAWAKPIADFYQMHPLLRILCEQPAIWGVPLAIILMIVISKLTRNEIPADIRMKMLVLHAPEKLGLKQEYIQEHMAGH